MAGNRPGVLCPSGGADLGVRGSSEKDGMDQGWGFEIGIVDRDGRRASAGLPSYSFEGSSVLLVVEISGTDMPECGGGFFMINQILSSQWTGLG